MNQRPANHARKLRQFRHLSDRINQLLRSGQFEAMPAERQSRLTRRLRKLWHALQGKASGRQLRKALGIAALLLGMGPFAKAQHTPAFAPPVTNPFSISINSEWPMGNLKDMDGDGDYDLLMGDNMGDFHYYENRGNATTPLFDTLVINPFGLTTVAGTWTAVDMVDIDGDGDLDVFVGETTAELNYYENTGNATAPAFAAAVVNPFSFVPNQSLYLTPTFADMDNDGDYDLLNIDGPGTLHYHENTGTNTMPNFMTAPVVDPWGITAVVGGNYAQLAVADYDLDGDNDILIGRYDGSLDYYMNAGNPSNPSFAPAQASPFGLIPQSTYNMPIAADLDADGDYDLLLGDYNQTMFFYEDTAQCTPPVADFLFTIIGDSVAFMDQSSFANAGATWLWDFGNGSTDSLQNPSETFSFGQTVTVCLSISDLCGSDSICQTVAVPVGQPEPLSFPYQVFPNPTDGRFNLHHGLSQEGWIELRLYDAAGRLVANYPKQFAEPGIALPMELPDIRPGVYFLQLVGQGKHQRLKVVKR